MRNVIFDLGGVVFDWNPDAILAGCYADPGLRATLKAAVFQHEDWLLMDRGVLTEADAIARFESRNGRSTQELAKLEAGRSSASRNWSRCSGGSDERDEPSQRRWRRRKA